MVDMRNRWIEEDYQLSMTIPLLIIFTLWCILVILVVKQLRTNAISVFTRINLRLSLMLNVKNTTKAHLAVLLTNLFFAANYTFVKMISPSVIKPFGLNLLRVFISMVLFWLLWWLGKTPTRIQSKDIGRFILCGITGVAINQMFFVKG